MVGPILIAGEDAGRRNRLSAALIGEGYRIIEAESGYHTLDLLRRRSNIMLALVELTMSDINRVNFVANLRAAGIRVPIIVMTAKEDEERLQQALDAGANDFLIYPFSELRLCVSVSNILQRQLFEREVHVVRRHSEKHLRFDDIVTRSTAMQELVAAARALLPRSGNLLIKGEDGSGRETLARIMHQESARRDGAFRRLQCLAFGDDQDGIDNWKSELGTKLKEVQGGTLFLSDVYTLDESLQSYLLSVLEKYGSGAGDTSIQFIATAIPAFEDMVVEGAFGRALYEQLSPHELTVPPLRLRRDDIADIANVILARIISETGHVRITGIAESAMAILLQHNWPGNVSELENLLFRAVLLSDGPLLVVQNFPQLVHRHSSLSEMESQGDQDDNVTAAEKPEKMLFDDCGHIRPLALIERRVIETAMERYRGKISEVARRLQIGRSTLYRKLDEIGVDANSENMSEQ